MKYVSTADLLKMCRRDGAPDEGEDCFEVNVSRHTVARTIYRRGKTTNAFRSLDDAEGYLMHVIEQDLDELNRRRELAIDQIDALRAEGDKG